MSRPRSARDGHSYAEQGHASCPRLAKRCVAGADCDGECDECEECDGLVTMTRTGEADDVNDFNGGTPGWEEVEIGECSSCGASDWTEDEDFALRGNFTAAEPDRDYFD